MLIRSTLPSCDDTDSDTYSHLGHVTPPQVKRHVTSQSEYISVLSFLGIYCTQWHVPVHTIVSRPFEILDALPIHITNGHATNTSINLWVIVLGHAGYKATGGTIHSCVWEIYSSSPSGKIMSVALCHNYCFLRFVCSSQGLPGLSCLPCLSTPLAGM